MITPRKPNLTALTLHNMLLQHISRSIDKKSSLIENKEAFYAYLEEVEWGRWIEGNK